MRQSSSQLIARFLAAIAQHSILIALALMFAYPFVWMVATSAKVEREMFSPERPLFPRAPLPRTRSPFVDMSEFPTPTIPDELKTTRAPELMPAILQCLDTFVRTEQLFHAELSLPGAAREAVEGLWERLLALTPHAVWTNPALTSALVAQRVLRPHELSNVLARVIRSFSLRTCMARDDALTIYTLAPHIPFEHQWRPLQPSCVALSPAHEDDTPCAHIAYTFPTATNVLTLEGTFQLPFPASNLFQFTLAYRPDDTWHRLYVRIEGGGRVLVSQEPVYLFDINWSAAVWQRRSAQDEEVKIKRWIPLEEIATGPAHDLGPHTLRVTLELRRSNLAHAWLGKLARNYRAAFKFIPFWRYVATSIVLVILNIIGTLASSSLVAYSFARLRWPGRDLCFLLLLATLMVPPQVTMIPGFIIIKWLGWYNTLQPLWVFSFCGNAFFIFLLRQFMKGIPNDLEDAARIDGCGFLRIYWHVILPLIKPSLAAIAIFTFMGVWNDFMGPLILLNDHRLYPLSLGLFSLNVQAGANLGMMMAGSFLMTLPVLVIFFFAQKYFIQGITLTGMKG
ncbi:MAG: ABC transporter permease subunit [bacterium]|nr:ABC transporter permease subunit [bacterium]